MLRPRIIPSLLVHRGGLVKTVKFRDPKYVGDPINAVKIFNEKECDELTVLDIDASANGAEPDYRMIGHLALECRMPLCYGGGVKTVEQASRIVSLGVEKVAISSAAIQTPELVGAMARELGSQSVVVVLDAKKRLLGRGHEVYTHNGKQATGVTLLDAARAAQDRGAGEIVVNLIDHDGQMKGYDLGLARTLYETLRVPLTMLGGAGSLDDIGRLIETCGVVGAAAGSLFVFKGPYRAVLINYPTPAVREALIRKSLTQGAH